jgi:hypothetical protein
MLLLPLLAGCVINGDKYPRPRDLTPAWKVDKPRILAVVAEPPEARPGELVTFSALVGRPPGDEDLDYRVWLACPLDESVGATCGTSLDGLDLEELDPEALAELGLIGFEPFLPPAYVVPTDALDALSPEDRLEGTYVLVQTTVLPPEAIEDPEVQLDPATLEASYKRLVVSLAPTPNHNPGFVAFGVDGIRVPADGVVHVDRLQVYDLEVVLSAGSIETYTFVNSDGVEEERVEEPYVAWYATDGDMTEEVTLYPYLQATWVAPERSGTRGTWYAVARDRRGGMAFWTQSWVVD